MARKPDSSAATEVLEGIETLGDRLAEWVGTNPRIVIGVAASVLGIALVYGITSSVSRSRGEEGAAALAEVRAEYLKAMGASPTALVLPELANPAAALRVRADFGARFAEVAAEHAGTTAGAMAWIQVGDLQRESGDPEAAIETWLEATDDESGGSPLRGILLERIGQAREGQERWLEAAEAHAEAGRIDDFPLRSFALADAARCFATAGENERSLEYFERLEKDFPDFTLPNFLRTRLRELRALEAR